jgi:hypothetical protein
MNRSPDSQVRRPGAVGRESGAAPLSACRRLSDLLCSYHELGRDNGESWSSCRGGALLAGGRSEPLAFRIELLARFTKVFGGLTCRT